jgi:hypothetical protein
MRPPFLDVHIRINPNLAKDLPILEASGPFK